MRAPVLLSFLLTGLAAAQTYRAVDVTLTFGSGIFTAALSHAVSATLGSQKPTVKNGVAYVGARQTSGAWDVGLSPKLPLALNVTQESGSQDLNLRGLPLTRLNVKMGSGPVDIQLPAASLTAQVRQESGSLDLYVPQNTGLKLVVNRFESGALTMERRTVAVGDSLSGTYQTSNYDTAKHKVTVNLIWGSGPVQVHTPGQ
ncbi:DUF4097 domain-containing protein [Deinococcus sp. HMF7604]|uniref:DUF4097 domain-containing protein n=1 Tax=Deinococcus betulae TaxID=2873312 RepID=UPI001CCADFE4|nr:DUF4097 domain-containing protein [Deinococcus betulae]MBZ9752592.1 DUF4097 domain-containing protein [Deinococcus betulae]